MYPGQIAESHPHKPALTMAGSGEVVTFAELEQRSCRLARLLYAQGLRPGDHITLFAECHPRYSEVAWAALRSGLYLTTVNAHFGAEEARYVVENSTSRVLITTRGRAGIAAQIRDRVPAVDLCLMMDGVIEGFDPYEEALASYPAERLANEPLGELMLYSSGSTGRPKGIKRGLSGRCLEDGPADLDSTWAEPAGVDEHSVCLLGGALHHAAPLVHGYWTQCLGGSLVIQERFDAEAMLRIIESYRVSHGFFVPTMFVRLLRLASETRVAYDVSSLRYVVHAGAPCPVVVKQHMIEWWGPVIEEYYAATEGHGMTWIGSRDWLKRPGSVGRAIWGRLHIVDETGNDLPPGELGTVYFSGTGRFEYLGDTQKTAEAYLPDGRATVGDIGYTDEAGYLYLVDRKHFTIVSGGVNIYPKEIEECLILHPAVDDVAVFGVPDEEFGEAVKAVVQPMTSADAGPVLETVLIEHCRANLAHFKCPRSIDFTDHLPRDPSGKLFKRPLKDRYWPSA